MTKVIPKSGSEIPQHASVTVAGMITCSVLRCTNPGAAFLVGNQTLTAGYYETYVCTEHQELIDAGAPWDMEGHIVLMGRDLAPILENWFARPSAGSEGFTLTLRIQGQIKPVEAFLLPTEARTLSAFINAVTSGGC